MTTAGTLRRGLPRAQGGEPWPPAGAVAKAPKAAEPALATSALHQAPENGSGEREQVAGAVGGTIPLRRGLPRAAGGAAWPAEGFAPSAAVAVETAPTEEVAPTDETPAIIASASERSMLSAAPDAQVSKAQPAAGLPRNWYRPGTPRASAGLLALAVAVLLIVAAVVVVAVQAFLATASGEAFLTRFPGQYQPVVGVEHGFPAWVRWQHFFNVFLIVLIIRSGMQVRGQKKPPAYWSSKWNRSRKISINLWLHQALDILWIANGVVFIVVLISSGRWARIVPTSWEVFPNALSAGLQYASLNWPVESGWANYNSLQQLAYFVTVFVAAPLAVITGVRMSGIWPTKARALSRVYPIAIARAIHFPVMLYFVVFIIFHVTLVLATGALRNLNHMYAGQDVVNWVGFWIFAGSIALIIAAVVAARPLMIASIAALFGRISNR